MYAQIQLPPPSNWQDFQELCRVLWKYVWSLSDEDIILYGDNGDKQDGVDICAIVGDNYYGIQCKSKDQLKEKQITKAKIDAEIEKAKLFSPKLSKFLIVTSASKNAQIDNYALKRNAELQKQGYFGFRLLTWKDVCNLLMEHKAALNFYQNKVKANYIVDVTFNGSDSYTIFPMFLRKHIHYKLKTIKSHCPAIDNLNAILNNIDFQKVTQEVSLATGYSERWHTVPVCIVNVGDSVLRNFKFELVVDNKKIKRFDHSDGCFAFRNCKGFVYYPIVHKDLVQNDGIVVEFYIIPQDDTTEIRTHWEFKAEDFSTGGELKIHVVPQYEDVEETIEVETEEQLKEDEIVIEPKKE